MSDRTLQPYSLTSYQNEELKSLTRYRADKVRERAKLKSSLSRLVVILFPELEKLVPTLHMPTVYDLLNEFPGASHIASAHLTRLSHLFSEASKGHYGKDDAIRIRNAARRSIGLVFWIVRSMRSSRRSLLFWINIRRRCWTSRAWGRVWLPLSLQRSETSDASHHRISCLRTLVFLRRPTSPDS